MQDDETLGQNPALAEEWRKQEAARMSRLPEALAADRVLLMEDGYIRLIDLMADARGLHPPVGLSAEITNAVQRRVEATRQVEVFRRAIRRVAIVPIAGVVLAGMASVSLSEWSDAFSSMGGLLLPLLALLLGALPLRPNESNGETG